MKAATLPALQQWKAGTQKFLVDQKNTDAKARRLTAPRPCCRLWSSGWPNWFRFLYDITINPIQIPWAEK